MVEDGMEDGIAALDQFFHGYHSLYVTENSAESAAPCFRLFARKRSRKQSLAPSLTQT